MFSRGNEKKTVSKEVKASVAYTVCSILQNSIGFITLPLFTRLLSTSEYGQYSIYSSWMGILTNFLTLNLPFGSFQKAMVKFEDRRDEYISSVEGIILMLCSIFLIIYLPFRNIWNVLFELPTTIMLFMIAEILMNSSILLWNGKKRFEYRYIEVVIVSLVISFIAPVVAYLFVMNSDDKGNVRIIGSSSVVIIIGSVIFLLNIIRGGKLYNKEFWKYALGFNVPLLAYYVSQVIFNQSDRIMISHFNGKDKAAIYGVAYTIGTILTFVLNAINNSYLPWYYNKLKEKKYEANKNLSLLIALLMAVLLMGVIWIAPEVILLMAGEEYREAVYIVAPVAMSMLLLFYSQLFINTSFYYEKKKALVKASVLAAVTNIVLNYIFIPKMGFLVAGYTTLLSYLIFALCNFISLKNDMKNELEVERLYHLKGMIGLLGLFLFIMIVGVVFYDLPIVRYSIIGFVILMLLIFHKQGIRFVKGLLNSEESKKVV